MTQCERTIIYLGAMTSFEGVKKNKGVNMTDQTDRLIAEVQSKNKAENYHKENTNNFNKAKDIYKASDGLDNISEFDMKKFNEIMRS